MQQGNTKIDFSNLVPLSEIPDLLPIAEKTLRNWRSKRLYPSIWLKLGGKVFVDTAELSRILEGQKEKAVEDIRRLGV